jgi:flagellar FliL protein
MADEAKEETETQEEPKGGKPWLLIVLASLISIALGAGGTFFLLGSKEPAGAAESTAETRGGEEGPQASFAERVFDLDPFVVNVTGEGYPRYLKLQVAFEMDSLSGREEIEARVAQVRDSTILLLSSKRLSDITEFEGKALLKDDLRERVNALLDQGQVRSVMFTEFVVQ